MAIVARDSKVIVVFVSNAYAADPTCCSLFKFVRHVLQKPWVMVVIGEGVEWKKSSIGVFISDEVASHSDFSLCHLKLLVFANSHIHDSY